MRNASVDYPTRPFPIRQVSLFVVCLFKEASPPGIKGLRSPHLSLTNPPTFFLLNHHLPSVAHPSRRPRPQYTQTVHHGPPHHSLTFLDMQSLPGGGFKTYVPCQPLRGPRDKYSPVAVVIHCGGEETNGTKCKTPVGSSRRNAARSSSLWVTTAEDGG